MTVRFGTRVDRFKAISLLKASRTNAGFDSPDGLTGFTFPFVAAYAESLYLSHLDDPHSLCLVYCPSQEAQGLLLARAFCHMFGPVMMAQETVWFIDEHHRGRAAIKMLDAYEKWAAELGCKFVGMAGMGADPEIARLYTRRGYKVAETNFLKRL